MRNFQNFENHFPRKALSPVLKVFCIRILGSTQRRQFKQAQIRMILIRKKKLLNTFNDCVFFNCSLKVYKNNLHPVQNLGEAFASSTS